VPLTDLSPSPPFPTNADRYLSPPHEHGDGISTADASPMVRPADGISTAGDPTDGIDDRRPGDGMTTADGPTTAHL
jgi:hypothetical protein